MPDRAVRAHAGLVGAATALVVRRRLRTSMTRLALASLVLGTAVLMFVHLVPLMLGVFTRGTVMVAACSRSDSPRWSDPPAARPSPPPRTRPRPPQQPGVLGARRARLRLRGGRRARRPRPLGRRRARRRRPADLSPAERRRLDPGRLDVDIDQFVPLLAHGNYPNNGDVVLLSTVLPWHNDFLVRLPITFFLATTAVAVFAVARELRAPHAASVLAAAVVVSLPVVGIATIPRALPDSLMWTMFACGVLFLLRHARSARRSDLVLAGVALGIAAGTKWYGVSSVAVVGVVWVARGSLARRGATAAARPSLRDGVAARRPVAARHPALARAQPRPLRQPGLPAQGGAVRDHDLRRAARRHPRPGRLRDRRLRGRRGRPAPARRRDRRGPRRRADPLRRWRWPSRSARPAPRARPTPRAVLVATAVALGAGLHRHARHRARAARRPLARARQHALRRAGAAHRRAGRRLARRASARLAGLRSRRCSPPPR